MHYPTFEQFTRLTQEGNLIPIYREILADTETPVSALMKLHAKPHLFLLESVEGGEKWGRYTFLGSDPHMIFTVRGGMSSPRKTGRSVPTNTGEIPWDY
jgi:anthranilate synthase component 1